jgi:hypothetical protein
MESAALVPGWIGSRVYDREGARLGHVADVLFDDLTGAPAWLLLVLLRNADRFVLVPAAGVRHHPAGIGLAVERSLVRTAPTSSQPPGELGREHAAALCAHYGVRGGRGPWSGTVEPHLAYAEDRVRMAG